MTEHAPRAGTIVCRLDELADGGGRVVTWGRGQEAFSVIVVRCGDAAAAYVNRCPHFDIALDHHGELTTSPGLVHCSHHDAAFRAADGTCVQGPCEGDALTAVPVVLERGTIRIGLLPER